MPLRAQYIADVGAGPDTYADKAPLRVAEIYQTARRGRIHQHLARQIWDMLSPVYRQAKDGKLPALQVDYDEFVIRKALEIQGILKAVDHRNTATRRQLETRSMGG